MRADVAIIGAGMAGASLAAELAPHLSVIVIEAESQAGYHSTDAPRFLVRDLRRTSHSAAHDGFRVFSREPPTGFAEASS
jgi:D-arginine dehydrogenase